MTASVTGEVTSDSDCSVGDSSEIRRQPAPAALRSGTITDEVLSNQKYTRRRPHASSRVKRSVTV